ncbi:MAG: CocE/NonD family hydrolase [Armatimonadetes bacterium]|nr:CocE/NonD family hydrolase [Armatimonadota bacterium]
MGRILLLVLVALLVLAVVAVAQQLEQVRLEVQVRDPDGRPLGNIPVGVLRLSSLGNLADDAPARPEQALRTNAQGLMVLQVPATLPGLDRVVVFTLAPAHRNVVLPDLPFQGPHPTAGLLRGEGVLVIDLHQPREPLTVTLRPVGRKLTARVPMRDGVHLATDIYLPEEGDGPWPVILTRTPYNKAGRGDLARFTTQGYAAVAQDSRGRFGSEGQNLPFMFDGWGAQQDGVDTARWIGQQPWCNGKIGTTGGSAGGITQLLTAAAEPPHYACQIIDVATASLYHDAARIGGAYGQALLDTWLRDNHFAPEAPALMRGHETYDEFWQALNALPRAAQTTVPALLSGGWYDIFSQGTIDAFMARQYEGGAGARGNQKLLMGPWPHGRRLTVGELTFPEQALRPPWPTEAEWFDHWLKGIDNQVNERPAVVYYAMGACGEPGAPGHEWRTSDTWPPACTPTAWHLRADGGLTPEAAPAGERNYRYDPASPVPTRGGNNLTIPAGPMDQRPVEGRPDVLVFTSAPLTAPLEITGRVTARLWVASSAPDTDFTVKLTDVYPDGRSMLVLDGIRRMKFRNGFKQPELLTPGQVYPVEVDLWSTSLVFNRGHRLRVVVSSSNYPRFDANPNTGAPAGQPTTPRVASNTLFLGGERPSQVILPVR